jgi:hypothetical protein
MDMGAAKKQLNQVNEKEVIANVLFENGFVHLSDKKLFIRQLESGEYMRISLTTINNNILTFIKLFGYSSFNLENSIEHKQVAAKVASRLMQKYNEISE